MTTRSFTVSGALVLHQVRGWLDLSSIQYELVGDEPRGPFTFTVDVDDEQWAGIQEWVARL